MFFVIPFLLETRTKFAYLLQGAITPKYTLEGQRLDAKEDVSSAEGLVDFIKPDAQLDSVSRLKNQQRIRDKRNVINEV